MSELATSPHERAAEEFARRTRRALGDSVHGILLYGSTARGEAGERSDVDVMVVLTETPTGQQRDELIEVAFDVCLEYGVEIIPNIQSKERFESRQDHPFVQTVCGEGRTL